MGARVYVDRAVEFSPPEREAWMDQSACLERDKDLFFPEYNTEIANKAKAICNTLCPVRLKCLAKAMSDEDGTSRRYGIFGGMTPSEREMLQVYLDELAKKQKEKNNEEQS